MNTNQVPFVIGVRLPVLPIIGHQIAAHGGVNSTLVSESGTSEETVGDQFEPLFRPSVVSEVQIETPKGVEFKTMSTTKMDKTRDPSLTESSGRSCSLMYCYFWLKSSLFLTLLYLQDVLINLQGCLKNRGSDHQNVDQGKTKTHGRLPRVNCIR